jgi:NAD(P)-dependent dehydrogenase (short-subunit alcohol dehydrogenase family)
MNREVVVVIGAGGIGQAIARRQGPSKSVLLADYNDNTLKSAAAVLQGAGYNATTQHVDVSSRESVSALAQAAAQLGSVVQVVHTAGVSPAQAPPAAVLAIDLAGTAIVLEEFGRVIAPGGAGIVISSMAGYIQPPSDPTHQDALAHTPPMSCWGCRSCPRRPFPPPRPPTRWPSGPTTFASRRPASTGVTAALGSTASARASS